MTFIQSIFRYVLGACIVMAFYCLYTANRVDVLVSSDDLTRYLFLQTLFTAGAIASYLIVKHED